LAVNTGDSVFVFFYFSHMYYVYNDSCASAISVSQGVFASYLSLLEAIYRVKQQDKLIEWDTMTPKTQSNQRRANNCKSIVKETISPVY
jgi:hypothetical protein